MEELKVRACGLCFTVIKNEDYAVIDSNAKDSLVFRLLNLAFDAESKHVMCNVCSAELSTAQKFRMRCLDTDRIVNLYAVDTTVSPLDLKEIYMKERENKHVSEDTKICRLCMETINNLSELKSIDEELIDMIQRLIPEMNIFIIKNPVTCKLCLDSLIVHCNFLKKCSYLQRTIENISNERIAEGPFPVKPSDDMSVKIEDVDIEFEDVPELIKTECLEINYDEVKNESDIQGHEISSEESAACKNQEMECYKCNFCNYKTVRATSLNKHHIAKHKDQEKFIQMHKCGTCNYETRHKAHFEGHMLVHKDPTELQMYKCEDCNYETRHKRNFKRHILLHKSSSEVQVYKCEYCSYETKHKNGFEKHLLIHENPSKVPLYKCETCDYETRNEGTLKRHMWVHRSFSEVKMYKCEYCSYKTKYKSALKSHILRHKDRSEVEMYKCENCDYETKHKRYLKEHILIHGDPSKIQMYKCDTCNHETKNKHSLKKHVLLHKDPSEVQMYKCEHCNYETKIRGLLIRHMLIHKDPAEVQMYKCKHCDYETKHKRCLTRHMMKHEHTSDVQS